MQARTEVISRARSRGWRGLTSLLLLLPIIAVLGAQAAPAAAASDVTASDVCEGDVKVEVQGEAKTVTYTAPDGYLVDSWCVKAGTTTEVHDVNPPAKTITISHSSGKGVSHYTVVLVKAPEPKYPAAPTSSDVCEPAKGPTGDRITIPADANFTYTLDGTAVAAGSVVATGTSHVVVAVPKAGVVVKEGATTRWTFTFTKVLCVTPPPPTPVTPAAPTSSDVCEPAKGPTGDRITIPADANFTYTLDGTAVAAGEVVATGTSHVVVAVPKAGVVVKEGATTRWTFTFTKVLCVTPPPPPPPPSIVPPVVTPTEVLPEQAFGKAVGSVKANCQGTVRARLHNRSGDRVVYRLRVGTKVHRVAVRSQADRRFVTTGPARAVVVLKVGSTRLDRVRIPARCHAPEALPDTGLRATSS